MVMGHKGWRNKLAQAVSLKLAGRVSKGDFLSQLKEQWRPYIKRDANIEDEVAKARERVNNSDFKGAFDKVGVTNEDLAIILKELKEEKPEQVINKIKYIGRNDPCPCDSGKKYKKCCGR